MTALRHQRSHRLTFLVAGLYNLAWGLYAAVEPGWLFRFAGMAPDTQPAIFACLGMVVGVYGLLYLEVARRPAHGFAIAAVGLLGKVLGPIGLTVLVVTRQWPARAGVLCLANDLVWWVPFALYLHDAWPAWRATFDAPDADPLLPWVAAWTRGHRLRAFALVLGIGVGLPVGASYLDALTAPGTDSLAGRTVEWLRDHDAGPVVDAAEGWYYAYEEPAEGGTPDMTDKVQLAVAPATTNAVASGRPHRGPPPPLVTVAKPPAPGEGEWQPFGPMVDGRYAAFVTSIRPDARHTSAMVRVVWFDPDAFRFVQYEGDKLPQPYLVPNYVPEADQDRLLAAFSCGFRLSGSKGGFYVAGQELRKLRSSAASLVVDDEGRIGVGLVGRDYALAHLQSVRQNLDLIVENGKVSKKLVDMPNEQWGYTGPANHTAAWRSGAGMTADGGFIYVAGPALSIVTLGETLVRAGVMRGMQLEINREWITFNTYAVDPMGTVHGTKLDKMFVHPGDRFLTEDTRDFMGVFARVPGDEVHDPALPLVEHPLLTTTSDPATHAAAAPDAPVGAAEAPAGEDAGDDAGDDGGTEGAGTDGAGGAATPSAPTSKAATGKPVATKTATKPAATTKTAKASPTEEGTQGAGHSTAGEAAGTRASVVSKTAVAKNGTTKHAKSTRPATATTVPTTPPQ